MLDRLAETRPTIARPRERQIDNEPRVSFWHAPAVIAENNFIYKSLSNWAFNVAVGCSHACRFCYVPSVATIKQAAKLAEYGVEDPDAEWGDYVLLRPWDEQKFLASLRSAENTPRSQLKPDGNRAVIYCSTTDPYQVIVFLHLWPDKSLGNQALAERMPSPRQYQKRLEHWWHRVSEWPRAGHGEK